MNEQDETRTPPGYYDSPWPEYSGHIKFKTPFTGAEYRAYVEAMNKPAPKDISPRFWEQDIMKRWRGARAVIAEWDIKDVPGNLLNDEASNVPLGLVSWTGRSLVYYVAPFLLGEPSPEPLTKAALALMD